MPEVDCHAPIDDLLRLMAAAHADFAITFRRLWSLDASAGASNDALRDLFLDRSAVDAWAARYAGRLHRDAHSDGERALRMQHINPKYALRNHLAEAAIRAAEAGDFGETERLRAILQCPFDEQLESAVYADFPSAWAQSIEMPCSS